MKTTIDFSKDAFVVITGASQGIGQAIAVEISKVLTENSTLLLMSRSPCGLNESKRLISDVNPNVNVLTVSIDLSKPNFSDFEKILSQNVSKAKNVNLGVIFHNAGQVGTLNVTIELKNLQSWHDYYDLNLFSAVLLNSAFVNELNKRTKNLAVINITSLCGRKPFVNMAMYGSAKAARDLFFQVFDKEEKNVLVLNYSPGPVETKMINDILTHMKDENLRENFAKMKETKTILTPEQTVKKLVEILSCTGFESGSVIDYYD